MLCPRLFVLFTTAKGNKIHPRKYFSQKEILILFNRNCKYYPQIFTRIILLNLYNKFKLITYPLISIFLKPNLALFLFKTNTINRNVFTTIMSLIKEETLEHLAIGLIYAMDKMTSDTANLRIKEIFIKISKILIIMINASMETGAIILTIK